MMALGGWTGQASYTPPARPVTPPTGRERYRSYVVRPIRAGIEIPCHDCGRDMGGSRHLARVMVVAHGPLAGDERPLCWVHYAKWAEDGSVT